MRCLWCVKQQLLVVSFVQKITNGDETQLPNFSVCLAADRPLDGVEWMDSVRHRHVWMNQLWLSWYFVEIEWNFMKKVVRDEIGPQMALIGWRIDGVDNGGKRDHLAMNEGRQLVGGGRWWSWLTSPWPNTAPAATIFSDWIGAEPSSGAAVPPGERGPHSAAVKS